MPEPPPPEPDVPETMLPSVLIAWEVSALVVLNASARAALAVFDVFWISVASCSAPVSAVAKSFWLAAVLAQRLQQAGVRRRRGQHVVDQARQGAQRVGRGQAGGDRRRGRGQLTGEIVGAVSAGESCQFQNRVRSIFSADGQWPSTPSPSTPRVGSEIVAMGGGTKLCLLIGQERLLDLARVEVEDAGRTPFPHLARVRLRNDKRQDHRVAEESQQPVLARSSAAGPSGWHPRRRPTARRSCRHPAGSPARPAVSEDHTALEYSGGVAHDVVHRLLDLEDLVEAQHRADLQRRHRIGLRRQLHAVQRVVGVGLIGRARRAVAVGVQFDDRGVEDVRPSARPARSPGRWAADGDRGARQSLPGWRRDVASTRWSARCCCCCRIAASSVPDRRHRRRDQRVGDWIEVAHDLEADDVGAVHRRRQRQVARPKLTARRLRCGSLQLGSRSSWLAKLSGGIFGAVFASVTGPGRRGCRAGSRARIEIVSQGRKRAHQSEV